MRSGRNDAEGGARDKEADVKIEIRGAYGTNPYEWSAMRSPGATGPAPADLAADRARRARELDVAATTVADLAGRLRATPSRTASTSSDTPLSPSVLEATAATLRGTAEVNTAPTSYGPRQPSWTDGSGAKPTISGTYTGGADTRWTFDVTQVSILGLGSYKIRVTDGAGATVKTLTLPGSNPAGTYAVADGLSLTLTSGTLKLDDTMHVDVRASVPGSLDPTKAFNGTGDAAPGFDSGHAVTAGSFTVNGTVITVAANDTVNSVLARLSASAAGVDAVYDVSSDKVILTARQAGSGGAIALANDSSGLLAALKLAGAQLQPGVDPDADRPMAQLAQFSGVRAGVVTVNGTAVVIDPATDSLRTVLARISAETGVSAYLVGGDRHAVFAAGQRGGSLKLEDASGLLDALSISRRDVAATKGRPSSPGIRQRLTAAIDELRTTLQAAWDGGDETTRAGLREAIDGGSSESSLRADLLGVRVVEDRLVFGPWDADQAAARLASGAGAASRLLTGSAGRTDDGLAERVAAVARQANLRNGLFL
jgi:hypothetical protein